jgi:DnaJ-class molecular chaperone
MNPYEVLGVPQSASKDEIRAKYKELARLNHPDKLLSASEEERDKKQEYFKHVTVAYHILMDQQHPPKESEHKDPDYWKTMWTQMESFLQEKHVWSAVKNTFVDVATKYITKKTHKVKLPVTLEEVYFGKQKRVQFFLQAVVEPVRVTVSCAEYPETEFTYDAQDGTFHIVHVLMVEKDHEVFQLDDGNLHTTMELSLKTYLQGATLTLRHLSGEDVQVVVPAFQDLDTPIVVQGRGISEKNDMIVEFRMSPIHRDKWDACSDKEKEEVLKLLEKIC